MRRTLFAAGILLLLASAITARGRGNIVQHFDARGMKEIWASEGSCRHHLSAHADDRVAVVGGWSQDVTDCQ